MMLEALDYLVVVEERDASTRSKRVTVMKLALASK